MTPEMAPPAQTTAQTTASAPGTRTPWLLLARAAEVRPARVALSIGTGTVALGSAVGLAAVAAWLIARAAGMPSPADLALAATVVRAFGIGRGVFRYLERLASHETALRATVALRARAYDAVARSGARDALTLRRGDILRRMGGDIDAIGDMVVRAVIPLGVALTVSTLAAGISLFLVPAAGLILGGCLLMAFGGAAALAWRGARLAAEAGGQAHARVAAAAMAALDNAAEHRVWGTAADAAAELSAADRDFERAAELSARPQALALALQTLCAGVALVAGVGIGVWQASAGLIGPTTAAVVALLPLAAFEAVQAVPAAIDQAFRTRVAAQRLGELVGGLNQLAPRLPRGQVPNLAFVTPESADTGPISDTHPWKSPVMAMEGVSVAWPGMTPTLPVTARVEPGGALGLVGRSGIGKSTLLLAMAGVHSPHAGRITLGGEAVTAAHTGTMVALTPEDAHLFGTTVLENLRVARGDVTPAQARAALDTVGLTSWLEGLPHGLDTLVGAGGGTVSGGERRRLLLARTLLSPAPLQLIDEPAEHLDAEGLDSLRATVRALRARGRTVVIVTHDLGVLDVVDEVISLDS